jgi:rhodanese-related sulfurtransferase
MPVAQIDPKALAEKLKLPKEQRPVLLDVRTPREHQTVAIPDSLLIPIQEFQSRGDELEALRGKEIIAYCHHGMRSLNAAAFLERKGITAASLRGGIDLYAIEVDPKLPRY